jgi:Na+/H+ antiporter
MVGEARPRRSAPALASGSGRALQGGEPGTRSHSSPATHPIASPAGCTLGVRSRSRSAPSSAISCTTCDPRLDNLAFELAVCHVGRPLKDAEVKASALPVRATPDELDTLFTTGRRSAARSRCPTLRGCSDRNPPRAQYLFGQDAVVSSLSAPLRSFLRTESGSAGVLLLATLAALGWANLAPEAYASAWETMLTIRLGDVGLTLASR